MKSEKNNRLQNVVPLAKRPAHGDADFRPFERRYRWVSMIGSLLYIEVVVVVGFFFAFSEMAANSPGKLDVLSTKVFIPLLIAIPTTAIVYLLAVIAALFQSPATSLHSRRAIQITVLFSLIAMGFCVWWVSRAFL